MQHLKGMNGHEGMYCEIHSKMWGLCDCCRANMSRMRAELRRQSAPFPSVSTSLKAASYSSILPVKRMLSWACKEHSQAWGTRMEEHNGMCPCSKYGNGASSK